ncbi:LuxR family transcriptional regulator [Catenulispora rubra]|uniref:AAA family ATPase n=1 Tax=Catenulispora rubra TaxID=280293 RepID=UPI00189210A1|nr:LuxR family transcriptional regulator [Catenulispora rubra]
MNQPSIAQPESSQTAIPQPEVSQPEMPQPAGTAPQLVISRSTELAAVRELIADPAERPRALVLTGEAGIGKSTVWSAGVELAREAGWRVLSARGDQTETGLSFAGLTDLLDPVLDEVLDRLPAAQRIALEVAMVRRLPDGSQLGPNEIGNAVAAAIRELSRDRRLLLAIDDLPWIDGATVAAFEYALSRLGHEGLRLLATQRTASTLAAAAPPAPELLPADDVRSVTVTAIDATAADDLLAERLDLRLPPTTLRGLVEHSGGNPFWILEFGAALRRGDGDRAELPIPTALTDLVRERLGSLPPDARQALVVTAALPQPSPALVIRALSKQADDPIGAVERAVADGVLTVSESQRLRPAHPLLGAAALDALLPLARAGLHRRLAELVEDPEQRARHVMLAAGEPPDAETADRLAAGAEAARGRGAVSGAIELADLAIRFTPPDLVSALAQRQVDTAELYYMRGDIEKARELAATAWAAESAEPSVRRRAMALLTHTSLYTQGAAAAQKVVDEALAETADDPWLRSLALAFAADFNVASDPPHARRSAVEAIEICDRLGAEADPTALSTALLALVEIDMFDGRGLDRSLVERAGAAQADRRWIPFIERAEVRFGLSVKYVDDLDTSRAVLTRMVQAAQDLGETSATLVLQAHLAYTEVQAGRPGAARAALAAFEDAAREAGPGIGEPASLTVSRALLAIMDGDLDGAEATLLAALERLPPIPLVRVIMDTPLATIALLRGDVGQAITLLDGVLEQARAVYVHEPAARGRPEGDLGQALVTAGRLDEAEAVAGELAEIGERLGRPTLSGIALRVRGMIAAAQGELDEAAELLTRAVEAHEASPMPIERGRSLLALGQVQRRRKAKTEARQALQDALDCFESHGHRPFAQLAEAELARGQRAGAGSVLTASEQRVADLVAGGYTNREVAARLSMSVRTVESHVASVFRKLGVRSRTELAGRFPQ